MVGAVLRVGINISIFLSIVHIEATVNETAAGTIPYNSCI